MILDERGKQLWCILRICNIHSILKLYRIYLVSVGIWSLGTILVLSWYSVGIWYVEIIIKLSPAGDTVGMNIWLVSFTPPPESNLSLFSAWIWDHIHHIWTVSYLLQTRKMVMHEKRMIRQKTATITDIRWR